MRGFRLTLSILFLVVAAVGSPEAISADPAARISKVESFTGEIDASFVEVWDAPNFNRRRYSGVGFYVYAEGGAEDVIEMVYRTTGNAPDGRLMNLDLRVFDPEDRMVGWKDLARERGGPYRYVVDLSGTVPGRYKIVVGGQHDGIAARAKRGVPIGLAGQYALGIKGGNRTYYLFVPGGESELEIWGAASGSGQRIRIYDGNNVLQMQSGLAASGLSWNRWTLSGPEKDAKGFAPAQTKMNSNRS